MTHTRRLVAGLAGALALTLTAVLPAAASGNGIGTPGVGDRFFPLAGNGGYDVAHYDLDLAWSPSSGVLRGTARIDATTTERLRQFDLDLRGFDVSSVLVNGMRAGYIRRGQELVIRPARTLSIGARIRIAVAYHGVPHSVTDPDGSIDGWFRTNDGVDVLSEPQGAPSWFPANDHPSNKATFTIAMTVPSNLSVISNGLPDTPKRHGDRTTYTWREVHPMATYLATVAVGPFHITTSRTASGIPIINAADPTTSASSLAAMRDVGKIITWESSMFGPYPFESVGAISVNAPKVGYSLETQTRPTFTFGVDDDILVHELAHQWFGDSVSLQTWPNIWLNEGFATYAEWLWSGHIGKQTPQQIFDGLYATPASSTLWTAPPGPSVLPGPKELFSDPVYDRGAMTLQALRDTIGDTDFFDVLRTWASEHRYGNGDTVQFIALAEHVSGRSLKTLFHQWLDMPSRPPRPPAAPGGGVPSVSAASHTARPDVGRR
jgi:aminopeptidase N